MSVLVISHVNPFTTFSGQGRRVFYMLKGLSEEFGSVKLITLGNKNIQPELPVEVEYLENRTPLLVRLQSAAKSIFGGRKKSNTYIPYLFRELKKRDYGKYQLIIFEYWHLYELASLIRSKYKNTRVFCDTHNILTFIYEREIKNSLMPGFIKRRKISAYRKLEFKKALPVFEGLISINEEEHEIFKDSFPGKEIIYCPMGLSLEHIQYVPLQDKYTESSRTIAYYGGLGNRRNEAGALWLAEVIREANANGAAVKYKIIGARPSEKIQQLAGPGSHVRVTGFADDLNKAFSDVQVAIIPWEGRFGFRSRIIELIAAGVPVVTTGDAVWGMGFTHGVDILIYKSKTDLLDLLLNWTEKLPMLAEIAKNAYTFYSSNYTFEQTYLKLARTFSRAEV